MKAMPSPIPYTQSDAWKMVLAETDAEKRNLLQTAMICRLTEADVEDLARAVETGADREREVALGYFYKLAMHGDRRLAPRMRDRLQPTLLAFSREHYPLTGVGRLSFAVLRHIHKQTAYDFLNTVVMETLPDEWKERFLIDMSLGTAQSIMRLREIQTLYPEWAEKIERQLERSGQMGARQIAALAAEWRTNRALKTLHKLQLSFLSNAQHLPIRPIVELLGEPDAHEGTHYTYHAFTDGQRTGSLHLEADAQGRLVSETLLRLSLS
jgi:hypothetical protein